MISLKNITKQYKDKIVLKSISLEIQEASVTSLLGINGAGKSTLSEIIAGIKEPSSGEIFFDNKKITEDIFSYKKNIGFCQQTPNFDSNATLYDNLFFSGKFFGLSDKQCESQIRHLEQLLDLKKYLNNYDYILSGGYKQRFMIARSLMHNPRFLILDEPTIAMDPNIRRSLWETITHLKKKGVGILLTTHYLEEAEILSDKVCILHQGEIKIQNTVNNLLTSFNKRSLEDVFISFLDSHDKKIFLGE